MKRFLFESCLCDVDGNYLAEGLGDWDKASVKSLAKKYKLGNWTVRGTGKSMKLYNKDTKQSIDVDWSKADDDTVVKLMRGGKSSSKLILVKDEKPSLSDEEKGKIIGAANRAWMQMAGDAEEIGATSLSSAIELVLDADRIVDLGRLDKDLGEKLFNVLGWDGAVKLLKTNKNRWY